MYLLIIAWDQHAAELRGWLRHRTGNTALADDLLQDLFLKALRQGERFVSCTTPAPGCLKWRATCWPTTCGWHTIWWNFRRPGGPG